MHCLAIQTPKGPAMEISDLEQEECWAFLGGRRLGRLACSCEGKPYVVPISFAVQRPYLYAFTTVGQKTAYLRANDAVCVQFGEIVSPQSWGSVVVNGKFQELTDVADQDRAHAILQAVHLQAKAIAAEGVGEEDA